jgi:hypothetical protein
MSARSKKPAGAESLFRVGDRVRFQLWNRKIDGVIVEDRGPLGVGGRRLYGIEYRHDTPPDPLYIELPGEEFELVEAKE